MRGVVKDVLPWPSGIFTLISLFFFFYFLCSAAGTFEQGKFNRYRIQMQISSPIPPHSLSISLSLLSLYLPCFSLSLFHWLLNESFPSRLIHRFRCFYQAAAAAAEERHLMFSITIIVVQPLNYNLMRPHKLQIFPPWFLIRVPQEFLSFSFSSCVHK